MTFYVSLKPAGQRRSELCYNSSGGNVMAIMVCAGAAIVALIFDEPAIAGLFCLVIMALECAQGEEL